MRKDLLFDNDIVTADGDFVTGLSDEQHIEHILIAAPGHYKQSPLTGADVTKMLGGPFGGIQKRAITLALLADGYEINDVSLINGELHIDTQ